MNALPALLLLLCAQDAVEVKTNDGVGTPQIRMAFSSGASVTNAEIRNARLKLGSAGYFNVDSAVAATPVSGDLRYDSATSTLRYYDGAWKTVATSSGSTVLAFVQDGNSFGALSTLGTNDAQGLVLETNGSERLRILSAGDVGVGTSAPSGRLHTSIAATAVTADRHAGYFSNFVTNATTDGVTKTSLYLTSTGAFGGGAGVATNVYGLYVGDVSGGDNSWKIGLVGNESLTAGSNRANLLFEDTGAGHRWSVNVFGSASAEGAGKFGINHVTTGNSRLLIDTVGNVGIGTTSPSGRLHIKAPAATQLNVYNDSDAGQFGVQWFMSAGSARWAVFKVNDAETGSNVGSNFGIARYSDAGVSIDYALWITRSTGNVGIGNTGPGYRLEVTGDARVTTNLYFGTAGAFLAGGNQGGSLELGPSSGSGEIPFIDFHYGTGAAQDFNMRIINIGNQRLDFQNSGGTVMSINGGSVFVGATSFSNATFNHGFENGFGPFTVEADAVDAGIFSWGPSTPGGTGNSSPTAARSGGKGVASSSSEIWLNVYITAASSSITFKYRVSSEAGFDGMRFYVDGTADATFGFKTGTIDWATYTYSGLAAGWHRFRWRYEKDGIVDSGEDCCWIDDVSVTNVRSIAPGTGDIWATGAIVARSSTYLGDVAEFMEVSDEAAPGDVVTMDPEEPGRFKRCATPYDPHIAGVVSTEPSVLINSPVSGTPIGMVGRLPVRVVNPDGRLIRRGDFLTSSDVPGAAMRATREGPVIGYALEDQKKGQDKVTILLQVGRQYKP